MGHVVDDDGSEPISRDSGEKLRYRALLGTKTVTDIFRADVDVKGNLRVQLPRSASRGLNVEVIDGAIKFQSTRDFNITTRSNFSLTATRSVRILASNIELALDNPGNLSLGRSSSAVNTVARGNAVIAILESLLTALSTGPLVLGSAPSPTLIAALNAIGTNLSAIASPVKIV
jgi:hypothetical protein